jgi:hypothetical protein
VSGGCSGSEQPGCNPRAGYESRRHHARNHQIPGERFRVHERVRSLLLEVKTSPRGPQIILSRAHRNFLRRLLENEVPEIYHGMVEIRSISREPGQRSKVAYLHYKLASIRLALVLVCGECVFRRLLMN